MFVRMVFLFACLSSGLLELAQAFGHAFMSKGKAGICGVIFEFDVDKMKEMSIAQNPQTGTELHELYKKEKNLNTTSLSFIDQVKNAALGTNNIDIFPLLEKKYARAEAPWFDLANSFACYVLATPETRWTAIRQCSRHMDETHERSFSKPTGYSGCGWAENSAGEPQVLGSYGFAAGTQGKKDTSSWTCPDKDQTRSSQGWAKRNEGDTLGFDCCCGPLNEITKEVRSFGISQDLPEAPEHFGGSKTFEELDEESIKSWTKGVLENKRGNKQQ